ncbi:MAG: hypothetical protein ACHQF2_11315 [Flavobacteriales bacterium]
MNLAYKKTSTRRSKKFEDLQLGEQEKLALYLFSQKEPTLKEPLLIQDLYFMDKSPIQIKAVEKLGAQL